MTDVATACWFTKNKINYGIHFYSKDDASEEVIHILSTFKFSVQTAPTNTSGNYSNPQYKFSFTYPTNFSELSPQEGSVSLPWTGNPSGLITLADKSTLRTGTGASFSGFVVSIGDSNGLTLSDYVNNEVTTEKSSPRGIENTKITSATIGNLPALYVNSEANIRRYFAILPNSQKILSISTASVDLNFLSSLGQILSTFTFTK